MCGIAGVLSLGSPVSERDRADARNMTAVLKHRGPNSRGFYEDEACVLGNARLSIIDLSGRADLPMSNEDGTVWIAYNGEVTNFRELRTRFKLDERHAFKSTSDTEVLVHLYEELGIGFLEHLSGMFAFCLYDKRKRKAFVVRDFYGMRPLFTMVRGDRFYFASEIKSFLELPSFDGKIDEEAIYHYFSLAYIPDVHTPFKSVRELQGGMLFEVDLATGRWEEREYYRLAYEPDRSITEKEAARTVHDLLLDSVRRNLIADVPTGLTLSGGVDTSTLLALMKELGVSRQVHTFSIRMNSPSYDESYWQRLMVDFAQPIHHEITVNPADAWEHFLPHVAAMDEPDGDGAAVPLYILAKEAKKDVSVLLSGEGGDEVFDAYETHGANRVRNLYRRLTTPALRRLATRLADKLPAAYHKLSFDFLAKRFTAGAELGPAEAHLYWRHVLTDEEQRFLMPRHAGFRRTEEFFTDVFDSCGFEDELNKIALIDFKYFFIGDVMLVNDRVMMAHSIEARFPFPDRLLVDYVRRIPPELRLKRFRRRHIQKEAMRNSLPPEIYNRRNMGLEMPHSLWLMDIWKDKFRDYLTRERVERTGLLNYEAVERFWNDHMARRKDYGRALWCIFSLIAWFDLYVHDKSYKRYMA